MRSNDVRLLNGCTDEKPGEIKALLAARKTTDLAYLGIGPGKDRLSTKGQCSVILTAHQFLESHELVSTLVHYVLQLDVVWLYPHAGRMVDQAPRRSGGMLYAATSAGLG